MSLKKFLYYITKEDGKSGFVENDVVDYSGQPKPLPETPIGWQDILIAFERSIDEHGLLTTYSAPIGLVRDGARIARDSMYKETTEVKRYLLIQRLKLITTPTTFNFLYYYFFRGELDFSKVEDTQDVVNVPVMESGLLRMYKSNKDTVYEFPMNDPLCVNLLMDGIPLFSTLNFLVIDNTYTVDSLIGISFINTEGTNFSVAGFTVAKQNLPADLTVSTEYFLQASANSNIRLRGTFNINLEGLFIGTPPTLDINLVRGSDGFTVGLISVTVPLNADHLYSFDVTIPTNTGDKWFLVANQSFTGSGSDYWKIQEARMYVDVESRYHETYVKCYKRYDLYRKICGKVFGDENVAVSALCQLHNSRLITCGDAIRGIQGATLKTSLSDFIKDCDATFMAGIAVYPDRVELESRVDYYTEADEIDLGIIKDFVKRPAEDLKCNTFKFGHPKQDIEDLNGKYDPNGNNQFSGPITKDVKEYDMVSPYKAGPYEIETLRINLDGKTSTDDNSDNDVFVIAAVPPANLTADVAFSTALHGMTIANADGFVTGQKIRITGSASNDGVYDITGVNFLFFFIISFAQPVVDESSVTVTIEWLTGAAYTLDRPAYTILEGVPTDQIFNLPYFTPMTMLKAHGRWIRSMNAGLDNQKIKFTSGKENKNTLLKTEFGSVVIDEDLDETIADLGDYLFLPWYFIFKTEVPVNLAELLEANPNRSFKFTDENGLQWRGFLRIAGMAPNDYTPQEFRLLATPNNNLELLING